MFISFYRNSRGGRYEKNEYESVWGVFSNDIGLKFYGDTVKAKRNTLEDVNKEIMRLLDKIDPMSYLG